ncbi:hypothetical protein XH83_33735 [Bradyrhizobium sp. CCBAU 53351]|uniref:hypothetical protein n=1 Tax=Bradyrhizobium sp. CCBAU 53351 TaxID=1325114 RepID=UPI001887C26B|nr:hypothetical protein [Bradyrhizobium sp. CCBAU 53351]QOZ79910.1 hypothetical protein XH83_33735 [Bradyrhizobium sp. CCBAU 53351]
MIEAITVVTIAGGVLSAVAAGIFLGSRYVDAKLHYEETKINLDRPVLAPQFRRGRASGEHGAA